MKAKPALELSFLYLDIPLSTTRKEFRSLFAKAKLGMENVCKPTILSIAWKREGPTLMRKRVENETSLQSSFTF